MTETSTPLIGDLVIAPDEAEIPSVSDEEIFTPEPRIPPPPYVSPFREITHTWYGTDGSVWNLSDPSTGVFIIQEGVEGLHLPAVDQIVRESPSLHGGSYRGYRVKPRICAWVMYVYSDESSEHWFDLDSRLWKAFKIGQNGTWRVTRPDGQFRELSMRVNPLSEAFDRDPGKFGWRRYPIQFTADENPFWTVPMEVPGSRVAFEFRPEDDFFGNRLGAPPFIISADRAETAREFTNAGDEDIWYKVEITGPMDSVALTIGERKYNITCNLGPGEKFFIDTDPRHFRVYDDKGANRIKSIDSWVFDPLPHSVTTTIAATPKSTGGGSVIIHANPLFHRAW